MNTSDNYWCRVSMEEYLSDIGRTSGSDLSNVDAEPERYGLRLAGKHVDRPTAAKGRGTLTHFLALEGGGEDLIRERFAFYPNRYDTMVPEKVIPSELAAKGIEVPPHLLKKDGTPYKTKQLTGQRVQQDGSEAGKWKSMDKGSDDTKRQHAEFMETAVGRTVVSPEDLRVVHAMVRALRNHEHAREYLGADMEPEVTGHWTCPITGEQYRIRPDGMLLRRRVLVSLKTVATKGEQRLDASNPAWAVKMARQGWARSNAMLHDGFKEIEGEPCTVVWLIVEAREDEPRVFVKVSESTGGAKSFLYEVGRGGNSDWGVKGYLQLAREAKEYRESRDFRPEGVRKVSYWEFPEGFMTSLQFQHEKLTGGTEVDHAG